MDAKTEALKYLHQRLHRPMVSVDERKNAQRLISSVVTDLLALSSPEGKAEAVVWRWELAGGVYYHDDAPTSRSREMGWTATPLYAASPPRADQEDEIRRLRAALVQIDNCARGAPLGKATALRQIAGMTDAALFEKRSDADG